MSTLPFNPDPYNTPDVQVSPLSVHTLFPHKKVPIGIWWEMWFKKGGTHLYPGFDSNDPVAIEAHITAIKAQGYDFIILDDYGTAIEPQHSASLLIMKECEKQGLRFASCMDKGMFQWNVPAGMSMEAWGQQQMAYIVKTFCSSPAYMRTRDGRFLMFNFDCPALVDMSKIMPAYPQVAMLYWKKDGISKPSSAGCYSWVGYDAANPVGCIERNLTDFLASADVAQAKKPGTIIVPALCGYMDDHDRTGKPGRDPTKSCWDQTAPARIIPWEQGHVLLNVAQIIDQTTVDIECIIAVTGNDVEENTALWRGAVSQVTSVLSVVNGILLLSVTGNLNAIDHVDFIVNGDVASTQAAAGVLRYDLSALLPASGSAQFTCYAALRMKALFQVPAPSNTVTTTAFVVAGQTVQVTVHIDTVDVPISGTQSGITATGKLAWKVDKDVQANAYVPPQTIWK